MAILPQAAVGGDGLIKQQSFAVAGVDFEFVDFFRLQEEQRVRNLQNGARKRGRKDKSMAFSVVAWGVFVLIAGGFAPPVKSQTYEPATTLNASQILPPELLAGPNHRVEERVYNDGYLNRYTVLSKFGSFVAVSTAMLRKRINEINAMVRMEQIEGTKEFTSSLKEAGTDTLHSWIARCFG